MQDAVDDRLDEILGVLRADHDVAELARPGHCAVLVDRERQDVGRRVLAAMVAVQRADPLLVDQRDREMPVGDAGRGQGRLGGAAEALVVCLDLDQRDARRRSSDVWPAACSS